MKNYLTLGQRILDEGQFYGDRTKVGRVSIFGTELRFNLQEGFPLVTSKKMFTKGIIKELLWFLKGSTNVDELIADGCHIWDDWRVTKELVDNLPERIKNLIGDKDDMTMDYKIAMDEMKSHIGSIGPIYGKMWRAAPGGGDFRTKEALHGDKYLDVMYEEMASDKKAKILAKYPDVNSNQHQAAVLLEYYAIDQIQELIVNLKRNPHSSRHVVSCWMPELLPDERLTPEENVLLGRQALAPCHCMFQCYVKDPKEEGGKMRLSLRLDQRSADYFFGVPFNIASYALLTMMIAQCVDMEADEFIWTGGDTHLYSNTLDLMKTQIEREPLPMPKMIINPDVKDIFSFKYEDFTLVDYKSHDAIKGTIAK